MNALYMASAIITIISPAVAKGIVHSANAFLVHSEKPTGVQGELLQAMEKFRVPEQTIGQISGKQHFKAKQKGGLTGGMGRGPLPRLQGPCQG